MIQKNNIIDISWPTSPAMTTYKNKGGVAFTPTKTFQLDGARETMITIPSHNGTHVDAPSHFIEHAASVDQANLSSLVGPCVIIDLTHVQERITKEDLVQCSIQPHARILLKTRNSSRPATESFDPSFVYLDARGAQYLVDCNVMTVGIDALGIERNQPGHETHSLLLSNNITIIEGLRLASVQAGSYYLCCLPLLLAGLDAAPARAIVLNEPH
ncbi:MAG: cyclase family protein [Candidatus Babeliales bacterium]